MIIYCATMVEFLDTIQGLVERGLMFEAYADSLHIKLTGGF